MTRHAGRAAATLALLGWLGTAAAHAGARLEEDVAYGDSPEQRLDLYRPDAARPPLLVFVHGRFWGPGERGRQLADRLARPLQRAGVAVAIVRHRGIPEHRHPAPAEDVAAALDHLLARPGDAFDRGRIALAGHGSGAHTAALVALDPRYLEAFGRSPAEIRAVVALCGHYDLRSNTVAEALEPLVATAFAGAAARSDGSPARHVRPDAPDFLLISAGDDLPGARASALAFAESLREAGHTRAELFPIAGDHWSVVDAQDPAGDLRGHLARLFELDERAGTWEDAFAARRYWRDPAQSTARFWADRGRVITRDADERLRETANSLFARPGNPRALRPRRYHALDLVDWVEQHAPGRGDYLTITNARGEVLVWRLSEIRAYEPELVIGLDAIEELFGLVEYYHTRRRYSWREPDASVQVMARPLGAFIHFRVSTPPGFDPKLVGRFALTPESFVRSERDPAAPLDALDPADRALVEREFRCTGCHRLLDVGGRAGHLRSADGRLVDGFALPLEAYAPEVWRRYCFEHAAVADAVGATAIPFTAEQASQLYELVESLR